MPIGGARPKPPGQAVTRHKPLEWDEVPNVPFRKGQQCPQRKGVKSWPEGCRERWAIWSTMPHCVLWSKADWTFAVDTLHIAARAFETESDPKWYTELRNREKVLGTTVDYRRALRIRYVEPTTGKPVDVAKLDDYRDL
jgi:hypothetical protein